MLMTTVPLLPFSCMAQVYDTLFWSSKQPRVYILTQHLGRLVSKIVQVQRRTKLSEAASPGLPQHAPVRGRRHCPLALLTIGRRTNSRHRRAPLFRRQRLSTQGRWMWPTPPRSPSARSRT